jgi:hypothetical protein
MELVNEPKWFDSLLLFFIITVHYCCVVLIFIKVVTANIYFIAMIVADYFWNTFFK